MWVWDRQGLHRVAVGYTHADRSAAHCVACQVTGVPVHEHEDAVSVSRITRRPQDVGTRGGYFPPFGLHHETDTRPHRIRTVLVYLTHVEDGGAPAALALPRAVALEPRTAAHIVARMEC